MPYALKLATCPLLLLLLASSVSACDRSASNAPVEAPVSVDANAPPSPTPTVVRASTHSTVRASLGTSTTLLAMEARLEQEGPLTVETVLSARWQSARSGLINLQHERAQQLQDGPEPIELYFHAITHPTHGLYVIDTGIEDALATTEHPLRTSAVGQAFNFDALRADTPFGTWLKGRPLSGVFLTHLHIDHVLGLPDVSREVPIFTGRGEAALESPFHAYTQSTVDALLADRPALQEWAFEDGHVIDVFGDHSLFALEVPGHTPGSVSFVARTTNGPVLFTGDVSHTAWGWQNDVEPGTFSHDVGANAASLAFLRDLAARHPKMSVRLGHQSL